MSDSAVSSIWEASGADRLYAALPEGLLSGEGIPDTDTVLKTVSGESVLARLWESFFDGSSGVISLAGQLCGVLVLCAVWEKYRSAVLGDRQDMVSHCMTLILALIGFGALAELFTDAAGFFSQIHLSVTSALTTLTALSAMRGAVQSAAAASMGMALFLAVTETVCSGILFPFLRVTSGLSLASSVGGGEALARISELLRRQFLWLIGAMMMLLCAVLSYQSILARASDSVTMRAVKFSLSGAVPIIGGAVGEAASAVAAGFSLVQKTVGVLGIAAVLWQILPTLCSVYFTRLTFFAAASLAGFLGMKREEGVLAECMSLAGFLLAVCAAAAVLYILVITLCMNGGEVR
ncbi:MAG: hypothetical protein E7604_02945 [Ruminococcaceae bacterium]|nr:hypothetical protein [Oscillospiraceae bacterium]